MKQTPLSTKKVPKKQNDPNEFVQNETNGKGKSGLVKIFSPSAMEAEHKQSGADLDTEGFYDKFAGRGEEWHKIQRKKLLRQVDWHLLPPLASIYLLSFLDKNNLAQARLGGLEADLHMSGTDFNTATSIYFASYIVFQLPANMLLTLTRPSLFLGSAALLWGVVSAAQAGCQSYAGLVVARVFLGLTEAPIFCGSVFLLSCFYTRAELAHRFAWFFSGAQLANAFGGLIGAGVVGNLDGNLALAAWRWLFIIEGSATVVIAVIAAMLLPDYPATTRFLSPENKAYAQWRLIQDTGDADLIEEVTLWEGIKLTLKDPRVYLCFLLQHCVNLSQTFQYFFPTIVKTLGYSNVKTLLITAPAWIAAFLTSLLVTWTAGRTGQRAWHVVALMCVAAAGNIIVTASTNLGARFFGMFLMPMGASSSFQIVVTWVATSFPRPLRKRSVVAALASAIGNGATIYGSYMYPSSDGPRYIPGGAADATICILTAILALVLRFWHVKLNKQLSDKEVIDIDGNIQNLHADDPEAKAVGFRYIL